VLPKHSKWLWGPLSLLFSEVKQPELEGKLSPPYSAKELYLHSLICFQGINRDTFAFVHTVMSCFHENAEDISYSIECSYKLVM
jgi:hypothetical protein